MADKTDPTKDPEFQKVVRAFLTTPPKRHEDEKAGKRKKSAPTATQKRRSMRAPKING